MPYVLPWGSSRSSCPHLPNNSVPGAFCYWLQGLQARLPACHLLSSQSLRAMASASKKAGSITLRCMTALTAASSTATASLSKVALGAMQPAPEVGCTVLRCSLWEQRWQLLLKWPPSLPVSTPRQVAETAGRYSCLPLQPVSA